jgi:hypothetical protein
MKVGYLNDLEPIVERIVFVDPSTNYIQCIWFRLTGPTCSEEKRSLTVEHI